MKHTVKVNLNGNEHEFNFDFPALVGTEKQIAYANDLRDRAIRQYCGDIRKISYCARKGESLEEKCLAFFKEKTPAQKIDLATTSAKEIIEAFA